MGPFHSLGATIEKDLSLYVDILICGTSKAAEEDLRDLAGTYGTNTSHRYTGAAPFTTLHVRSKILNSIPR